MPGGASCSPCLMPATQTLPLKPRRSSPSTGPPKDSGPTPSPRGCCSSRAAPRGQTPMVRTGGRDSCAKIHRLNFPLPQSSLPDPYQRGWTNWEGGGFCIILTGREQPHRGQGSGHWSPWLLHRAPSSLPLPPKLLRASAVCKYRRGSGPVHGGEKGFVSQLLHHTLHRHCFNCRLPGA